MLRLKGKKCLKGEACFLNFGIIEREIMNKWTMLWPTKHDSPSALFFLTIIKAHFTFPHTHNSLIKLIVELTLMVLGLLVVPGALSDYK